MQLNIEKEDAHRPSHTLVSPLLMPFTYGRNNTTCIDRDDNQSVDKHLHGGVIEFFRPISLESILQHPHRIPSSPSLQELLEYDTRVVCLLVAPAFMIPTDIIHFFAGSSSDIVSMRILQHYGSESYLMVIQLVSIHSAKQLIQHYSGQQLTSLGSEPTVSILYPIRDIIISNPRDLLNSDLNHITSIVESVPAPNTKPSTPHTTKRFAYKYAPFMTIHRC